MKTTNKGHFWIIFLLMTHGVGYINAQYSGRYQGPIIDMHMHCFSANWDEFNTPINYITGLPSLATKGSDLLPQTIIAMDKYNIVLGLLSGSLDCALDWKSKSAERFLIGPLFPIRNTGTFETTEDWPDLEKLRELAESGKIGLIGEITAQYAGIVPADTLLTKYFEIAEEYDLPVGIHTGNGTVVIINDDLKKGYRIEYGNPLQVNEIINRHPTLRIYLMHAGYPFGEDAIALMKVYKHVYADLSRMNWASATRVAFHNYLRTLIGAGLGDQLMFGSDGSGFPEAIGLAIEGIESAEFLTGEQKKDIFYDNAARFLRLSEEQTAKHHEK